MESIEVGFIVILLSLNRGGEEIQMKKWAQIFFICFIIMVSLMPVSIAKADDGGQVSTRLGITFEEPSESTSHSSFPSTNHSNDSNLDSATQESFQKPHGKLPNSGELDNGYLFIGMILILLFLIIFVISRKMEGRE